MADSLRKHKAEKEVVEGLPGQQKALELSPVLAFLVGLRALLEQLLERLLARREQLLVAR